MTGANAVTAAASERATEGLVVTDLRITSRIGGRTKTIVTGLDLSLSPGETIGIVGESGSGKSMTARALVGLLPTGLTAEGTVSLEGRDLLALSRRDLARVRGSGIGLILQDPYTMLNPLMRCGVHIEETLRRAPGGPRGADSLRSETVRRLGEVGIHDAGVADRYPFQLSGGMRQRVGIAAALAKDPEVLIADEPTTALDVTTQKEILELLRSLQRTRGMGLLVITHDLRIAFSLCDRLYVLYAGSLVEVAPAASVEAQPLHPYSLGLLLSEPPLDRRLPQLWAIDGAVPDPDNVADCCAFAPRCSWAQDVCRAEKPALTPMGGDRATACVRIHEITAQMVAERARLDSREHEGVTLMSGPTLIEVRELRKEFRPRSRRQSEPVVALDGVSLEVRANESVGLVGESGSGKTTLGRCLVGLEKPSEGRITVDGIDCTDFGSLGASERMRVRRTLQMVFQDPYSSLNPAHTVGFSLHEALDVGGSDSGPASVDDLLERVGLPAAYRTRKPVALSGGERQRVAIARALAVRPAMIVCDEPVSALDVSVQAQILNLLRNLRAETAVSYLFITHDLAVVRQVVERVYVLRDGSVVESGPVDRVLNEPQHPYTKRLVASVPGAAEVS